MRLRFASFLGLFGVLMAQPAHAAFLYCNRASQTIEAAFGYREGTRWMSEGWWQIQPGQCARVYNKPLTERFYFYFAHVVAPPTRDGKLPMVWSGKYNFCIDGKAFKIEGDQDCSSRGYRVQGFQEVDVGRNQKDYTLTLLDKSRKGDGKEKGRGC